MSAPRHFRNELIPPQPRSHFVPRLQRRRRIWVRAVFASAVTLIGLLAMVVGTITVTKSGAPGGSASVASGAGGESSSRTGPTTGGPMAVPGTAMAAAAELTVKGRAPMTGYERSEYGRGWLTVDGCSTREMILRRDLDDVTVARTGDCGVVEGTLDDPYTGSSKRLGYGTLQTAQIDHVVPLGDSWQKGAQKWSRAKRVQFANDPMNLLVTTGSVNASKGDGDAATWLPPNKGFRCAYVARQVSVKARYGVWVTAAEKDAMIRVLSKCPDQKLITAEQARQQRDRQAAVPTSSASTRPNVTAGKATTSASSKSRRTKSATTTDPRYPTCAAANRAGLGPYRRGVDPEYQWYFDRDGDGLACER